MGEEIELKLEIAPAAVPALLKCEALKGRGLRFRPARRLLTTYFDTPKGHLQKKGVYLRVRRDGARITQAVKTSGEGGVLARRGEWEWPLKAVEPNLDLAVETGLKPLVKRARKGKLKPIFASEIQRRTANLSDGEDRLELALDTGLVRAGRRSAALSELEIEVKAGSPAPLFALARELVQLPGLRVGLASKASRGLALAKGVRAGAVKAVALDLDADMTVAQAEARVLRSCAVQIAGNLPAVIDRRLPDGVHQMRVALRRLRAALSLFKDSMPSEARKRLRHAAGRAASALGPARDLDVLASDTLKNAAPPDALTGDIRALRLRLARMRREAWKAAIETVSAPDISLLLLDLTERAAALEADDWPPLHDAVSLKEMARAALEGRYEIVLALGQSIDTLSVPQRHELRLALKKLRYAADFFEGLFPAKATRSGIAALAGLQDAFGGFNDAASTAALLDAAVTAAPDKARPSLERAALFIKGWASHRADQAWGHARESWDAFAGKKPFWR